MVLPTPSSDAPRRRRTFDLEPPGPGASQSTVTVTETFTFAPGVESLNLNVALPSAASSAAPVIPASNEEVETFLALNPVDAEAGMQLRQMTAEQQRRVLERGDLSHARNPSAVLIARMRDAKQGSSAHDGLGQPAPPPVGASHPGIEAMIARYSLDARAAQILRGLPPHRQDAAAQIDLSEARRPSAFIMSKLASPQFMDLSSATGGTTGALLFGAFGSQI